jgi:hypothetical protein
MFRFLDKWRYDRILHAFCINPVFIYHELFGVNEVVQRLVIEL